MIRFLEKSLRKKIAIYYSGLSFLILVLVAGSAYILARSSLKQSMINQLGLAVSLKEKEINQWFSLQLEDVFLLAQFPQVVESIDSLLKAQNINLEMVDNDNDRDHHIEIKNILNKITELKSNIKIASVVSNQGIVLVSTNPLLEKTYQPLGHLTTYVTNPTDPINPIFYNSIITQNKAITFVSPIFNEDNRRIAYISIELDLSEVDGFLQQGDNYKWEKNIYLIGRIGGRNTFVNSLNLEPEARQFSIHSLAIDSVLEGQNGSGLYINHQNVPVLGLYRWLEDKNMGLVAEVSQKQAFNLAEELAQQIFIIGCILLVIILIIIYIISGKLVKPITEMSEAAIKISQGDLDCTVPVVSKDEIGKLAKSFNVMTEKLRHSFYELELINEELQIKIDELRKANQVAEKANQVKSEFISQMSHELRTPLNSILGFGQVLHSDQEIPDLKKTFLEGILGSGYQLLELINNVIYLCNKDEKKESSSLNVIKIKDTLNEIAESFKGHLSSRNLSLVFELEQGVPQHIQIDAFYLKKILHHLLDNAIKFTPEGEIIIKVSLLAADKVKHLCAKIPDYLDFNTTPVDWIQWSIQDTGCGIKPKELQNLFEPFARHVKTGGFQEGMGLGLPLCKKLVNQMGGEIKLESQVGVGTTVTVILPCKKLEDQVQFNLNKTETVNVEAETIRVVSRSIESWNSLQYSIRSLSRVWLQKMYQACCEADDQKVMELLDELPESESASKRGIGELAENYRLDKILELVEPLVIKD